MSKTEPTTTRTTQARLDGGLYIVATAIGNAGDMTLRAIDTLKRVDVVACEDTRVTGRFLKRHGIDAAFIAYHEHNAARARPRLLSRLGQGEAVALVSDAGTPLISDPGYRLVGACIEAGIGVTFVPGPSAAIAALVLSGLPTDRFYFGGFLPTRQAQRRSALEPLTTLAASLIFFESPRRLPAALGDLAEILGDRPACVARELTKKFEEVRRATLTQLTAHYRDVGSPKGEIVIVIAPPAKTGAATAIGDTELDQRLGAALAEASLRDAVAAVTKATGLPRGKVYQRALALNDKALNDKALDRKPRADGGGA